jgi:hypothetical protein
MRDEMKSLTEVMQLSLFYPIELNIWTDKRGLFHGKVYGSGEAVILIVSHNKQFINELLEELDDKANVFLEKHIRGED